MHKLHMQIPNLSPKRYQVFILHRMNECKTIWWLIMHIDGFLNSACLRSAMQEEFYSIIDGSIVSRVQKNRYITSLRKLTIWVEEARLLPSYSLRLCMGKPLCPPMTRFTLHCSYRTKVRWSRNLRKTPICSIICQRFDARWTIDISWKLKTVAPIISIKFCCGVPHLHRIHLRVEMYSATK